MNEKALAKSLEYLLKTVMGALILLTGWIMGSVVYAILETVIQ